MINRRKFLKGLGAGSLAGAVTGAGAAEDAAAGSDRRLYGVPGSLDEAQALKQDRIRLGLARADIPPQAWDLCLALAQLAEDVYADPAVAAAFRDDPAAYLDSIGFASVDLDPDGPEAQQMLVLENSTVRIAVQNEDPVAYIRALNALGIFDTAFGAEQSELMRLVIESLDPDEVREVQGILEDAGLPGTSQNAVVLCLVDICTCSIIVTCTYVTVSAYVVVSGFTTPTSVQPDSALPSALALALGGRRFAGQVESELVNMLAESTIDALLAIEHPNVDELRSANRAALEQLARFAIERQRLGHISPRDYRKSALREES